MRRDDFTLSTKVGRLLENCGPDQADPDKFIVPPKRRIVCDCGYDGVMSSLDASLDRRDSAPCADRHLPRALNHQGHDRGRGGVMEDGGGMCRKEART